MRLPKREFPDIVCNLSKKIIYLGFIKKPLPEPMPTRIAFPAGIFFTD